jgi:regulatory protein
MSSPSVPDTGSSRARRARSSGPAPSGEVPDPAANPEEVARLICLQLLTTAPRTRAQLADALRRRGVPNEAAEAVLDRFTDVRLIDDALYAQAWVDSRHRGRGLARRALAAELRQRGVAGEDIQEAVGSLDPEQELATARALVDKRLAATRGLPKPARFRRLMGMLARKGYSEGLAYRIVSDALRDEPSGPELPWTGDELPGPEPDGQPTDW